MVTSNHASALIIAKPSPLRVSLRALLIAMPQVGVVREADDWSAALQLELEPHPVLVLLDGDVVEEIWLVLRRMRLKWPRARFFFLASDVLQEKRASDARADAVLLKGSLPARLVAVLVSLLGRPEHSEEVGSVVSVSVQPYRWWLPRFNGQLETMVRGQNQRADQRGRARIAYQAVRR